MGAFFSSESPDDYENTKRPTNLYLGYKPELPHGNSRYISFAKSNHENLPKRVDLTKDVSDYRVQHQQQLNTAVPCAIVTYIYFLEQKEKIQDASLKSALFLYYNTRKKLGYPELDLGCPIRDAIESLKSNGICSIRKFPYSIEDYRVRPSKDALRQADDFKRDHRIRARKLRPSLQVLKMCIAKGRPFLFGYTVYESFLNSFLWDPQRNSMPIPNRTKEECFGGHCGLAIGYTDDRQAFYVQNFWSDKWGHRGGFFMPYSFFRNEFCRDFWILTIDPDDDFIDLYDEEEEQALYENRKKRKKRDRKERKKQQQNNVAQKEQSNDDRGHRDRDRNEDSERDRERSEADHKRNEADRDRREADREWNGVEEDLI
jgi:C1A family cysteine protease